MVTKTTLNHVHAAGFLQLFASVPCRLSLSARGWYAQTRQNSGCKSLWDDQLYGNSSDTKLRSV